MLSPWQRVIRSRNRQVPYTPYAQRQRTTYLPTTPGPCYELRTEQPWSSNPPSPTVHYASYDEMMWRAADELEKWDDFIAEMKHTKKRTDT